MCLLGCNTSYVQCHYYAMYAVCKLGCCGMMLTFLGEEVDSHVIAGDADRGKAAVALILVLLGIPELERVRGNVVLYITMRKI